MSYLFNVRYHPVLRLLFTALGMGPALSGLRVSADGIEVAMGWAFRAHLATGDVRVAARGRIPAILGAGVHGWAGRWAVNGSLAGGVRIDVDPPGRARVCGVPVRVRTLWVSLDDPDGFLAAVQQAGPRPERDRDARTGR